jgi:hypothetical protein
LCRQIQPFRDPIPQNSTHDHGSSPTIVRANDLVNCPPPRRRRCVLIQVSPSTLAPGLTTANQ